MKHNLIIILVSFFLVSISVVCFMSVLSSHKSFLDLNVESIVHAEEYTIAECIIDSQEKDQVYDNFCVRYIVPGSPIIYTCYNSWGSKSDERLECLKTQ